MPTFTENLAIAGESLRVHKLRAALTVLGLTMGVATLITVMTIVQGANVYVEQKVANLGINVSHIARRPCAVIAFSAVSKALRNKNIAVKRLEGVAGTCRDCQYVGAQVSATMNLHYKDKELQDTNIQGQTPNMSEIDTRAVVAGRFFSEPEDHHAAAVCSLGAKRAEDFLGGVN